MYLANAFIQSYLESRHTFIVIISMTVSFVEKNPLSESIVTAKRSREVQKE